MIFKKVFMKKVLVLYYSQTGQLQKVVNQFISKLGDEEISIDIKKIQPQTPYPFPWPFYHFFDEFPESVLMNGCPIKPLENLQDDYDMIILGYTVWYMAPSIPVTAFLQSTQAKQIFKGKPVVTLVTCRDMWVLAQEKVKKMLTNLDARLMDHVALTDQGGSVLSLVTLPRFLWTGKKDSFIFFPPAGIKKDEIKNCQRFGERLNKALKADLEKGEEAMLRNLGAVNVDGKLIATEKIADRSFQIWSRFIKLGGKKGSLGRKFTISIYVFFLLALILSVIPLNVIFRKIVSLFQEKEIKAMEILYELPSGR